MKIIILIFALLPFVLRAQLPPWNTKIVIQNPSGSTDTVWIGCDENANIGFQESFDILDTNLNRPVAIRSFDIEVENEFEFSTCSNLKKDIRNFTDTEIIKFSLIVITDEYPVGPEFVLRLDSLDFNYNYEGYRLTTAWLVSELGYLNGVDNDSYYFFSVILEDGDTIPSFIISLADMYPFDSISECSNNSWAMKLNLFIAFNMYPVDVKSLDFSSQINIFPNPAHDFVTVFNQSQEQILAEFYDFSGCLHMKTELEIHGQFLINISTLPSGIYFKKIINTTNSEFTIKQFIKT